MTATIGDPGREPRSRRVRLASMEALGFIDRPGMATTWVHTAPARGRHEAPAVTTQPDPFDDWQPTEVGSALFRRNVRWSLLVGILLMAAGAVVLGYWIYQRPITAAAHAAEDLEAAAAAIEPHLGELRQLNVTLTDQTQPEPANAALLAAEGLARDLFEVSGEVPPSDAATRSTAADAASDTLEATRLLGDAYAYREAVIPILALPAFEDDPGLIDLDDAARQFGEWHMKFDSVRGVLPTETLTELSSELGLISAELEATQSRYLDALRSDDPLQTTSVLDELAVRLETAQALLYEGLGDIQDRVSERLDSAATRLRSLLG